MNSEIVGWMARYQARRQKIAAAVKPWKGIRMKAEVRRTGTVPHLRRSLRNIYPFPPLYAGAYELPALSGLGPRHQMLDAKVNE